ncbi:hypothetical protein MLD38_037716 [Melastoma candidum]|uniref:Uncharacterized protein n=1 Tax=Melastoma candidum TaxID=119954 RepID=A0ACB9LP29_9MYRT|nr:hypothetical protein MLD38_037716 [Melastoma candidum]
MVQLKRAEHLRLRNVYLHMKRKDYKDKRAPYWEPGSHRLLTESQHVSDAGVIIEDSRRRWRVARSQSPPPSEIRRFLVVKTAGGRVLSSEFRRIALFCSKTSGDPSDEGGEESRKKEEGMKNDNFVNPPPESFSSPPPKNYLGIPFYSLLLPRPDALLKPLGDTESSLDVCTVIFPASKSTSCRKIPLSADDAVAGVAEKFGCTNSRLLSGGKRKAWA